MCFWTKATQLAGSRTKVLHFVWSPLDISIFHSVGLCWQIYFNKVYLSYKPGKRVS